MAFYLNLITYYAISYSEDAYRIFFPIYTYALSVPRQTMSKFSLCWLNRLQNRAVRLVCGLQKYDNLFQCLAGLGWLPIDQFVQYTNILTCFISYLGNGILFDSPIEFGDKHSYESRQPS